MKYQQPTTVAEAAKILDKDRPGWENLIDINKLDLNDPYECILAQIYGNYSTGYKSLFDDNPYGTETAKLFSLVKFTNSWKQEINNRLMNTTKLSLIEALEILKKGGKIVSSNNFIIHYDGHAFKDSYGNAYDLLNYYHVFSWKKHELKFDDLKPGDKFHFIEVDDSSSKYIYLKTVNDKQYVNLNTGNVSIHTANKVIKKVS